MICNINIFELQKLIKLIMELNYVETEKVKWHSYCNISL